MSSKRSPGRASLTRGPASRGYPGPGGGAPKYVLAPQDWRGTTVQACGLWPFVGGSGTPTVGVPVGRSLITDSPLCCDPVSWFTRANLISNPSQFVLGIPGVGKTTLVARQVLGLAGFGVMPMIFGDLKPDYVDLIRAMDGQVITLGRSRGRLNVLDLSFAFEAAARLSGEAATNLIADARGRRLAMVGALVSITRGNPPTDREETIIDRALKVLDDRITDRQPVLTDLLSVIREPTEDIRAAALDRGDMDRYHDRTEDLEASLMSMIGSGRLGEIFSEPTTTQMRTDKPVCFDVSSIDDSETDMQAAALLACWSYGFGVINAAHALSDAGLEPQRNYFVVLDELWRAIRAGRGLVDRVDALTRLNRTRGVGMAMISHTMADLEALPDAHDRAKAAGFVERAGMVITAGLPRSEIPRLRQAVRLSDKEADRLVSWSAPPAWDSHTGRRSEPPGRGHFLVKVGGSPGIPFRVQLTDLERRVVDSNRRWATARAEAV